jgi:hypothetical protein
VEEASSLVGGPLEVSPWVVAYLEELVASLGVVADQILEADPLAAGSFRHRGVVPPSLEGGPLVLRPISK